MDREPFLDNMRHIFAAARDSDDGNRCAVSLSPEMRDRLKSAMERLRTDAALPAGLTLKSQRGKIARPQRWHHHSSRVISARNLAQPD